MDFAAARAKLKKPSAVKDASSPVLVDGVKALDESKYEHTILDFNIERWLDLLGDATFATQFLSVSVEDARLFMSAFEAHESKRS